MIKMLAATTFTYDGIYSGIYGLTIAEIDSQNVQNATILSPTVKTIKTARRNRSSFAGIEYEELQTFSFSIMGEEDIPDVVQREILSWLIGRKGFKKLKIHQPEYDEYESNCIFNSADIILVINSCKGFTITATFDSPYFYGSTRTQTFTGDGTEYKAITIINDSDIVDDYIYPALAFKPTASYSDGEISKDISIKNNSDIDIQRAFEFSGLLADSLLQPDEEICIDNEIHVIIKRKIGDTATQPLDDVLSKFNKNWLRLKKGANQLMIRINGTCTIEVPCYVLRRF